VTVTLIWGVLGSVGCGGELVTHFWFPSVASRTPRAGQEENMGANKNRPEKGGLYIWN